MIEVERVKPNGLFTNYIFKAIPLAFDESMSYYETLCGLLDYMKNTMIPALNNNADAMIELQGIVQDLQTYVANYFDNLDVQEEINNKLDAMVEDGTLPEIIADYLNAKAVFGFDTVADMKNSTNLINGSYAKTLGYHAKNDGGSALYKIRTITNDDTIDEMFILEMSNDNTLVAELIYDNEIYAEQLGAYGDGTHDDTLKIQASINKNVKTILSKTYKITNTLTIDVGLNKGVSGNDIAKILVDYSSNVYDSISLYNSLYGEPLTGNYGSARDFIIKNIYLTESNEQNETEIEHFGSGIVLNNGCNNVKIDNVIISNFKYAIYSPNTAHGVYLNKFTNVKTNNNDYGIYINCQAVNDCGENFSFNQCSIATSRLGNLINSDMFVNISECSFDYNLGNTFILNDNAQVNINNSHIEWYSSTPLINITYNANIRFFGCTFVKGSYNDGGTPTNMIQATIGNGIPGIIFDSCTFLMGRTYNNLCNTIPYIKFENCARVEYEPTTFMTPYDPVNLTEANKYLYPLNYDSGLTRNQTKVKVTATTVKSENKLFLPLEYNNKDAKITLTLRSSISLNLDILTGTGKFLGENVIVREGAITKNVDLVADTDTTVTIYHKFRKGLTYTPYLQFNLNNLTQGATFEVKNVTLQVI